MFKLAAVGKHAEEFFEKMKSMGEVRLQLKLFLIVLTYP